MDNAVYSDWSTCSKTCGIDAIKTRTVVFPSCDGQAPEIKTEETLCTMSDIPPSCPKIGLGGNNGDSQATIDRLQAMIDQLQSQLWGLIPGLQPTEPTSSNIPQVPRNNWSSWSTCNYESDVNTQVCIGTRTRSKGLDIERESCPEPYLEWTSWTFAEDGITGEMVSETKLD